MRPGTAAAANADRSPPRWSAVFLPRTLRPVHAVDVWRWHSEVPPNFLHTKVVAEIPRLVRPSSHASITDEGDPAGVPSIQDAEPASVRLLAAFL